MTKELSSLNSEKERTIGNIPTKVVKTYPLIFVIKCFKIWNSEISGKQYFPQNLKWADITLAYVSALATVSKVFGGIIQKQLSTHIERFFFQLICVDIEKGLVQNLLSFLLLKSGENVLIVRNILWQY